MKIGQLLDNLGLEVDIDDSDMVTDVVVLAKVVTEDGRVALAMGASNEHDGIMQRGLLGEGLAMLDRPDDQCES
jgi:hypothetical protein